MNYTMNTNMTVQAEQFLDKKKLPKGVLLCEKYDGEIHEVPRDLLGSPGNPIYCVKHAKKQYEIIEIGDWVVVDDKAYVVIKNGMFKLLFKPQE